jgi:hypothetical protein
MPASNGPRADRRLFRPDPFGNPGPPDPSLAGNAAAELVDVDGRELSGRWLFPPNNDLGLGEPLSPVGRPDVGTVGAGRDTPAPRPDLTTTA